ncbi:hypothetical protein BJ970_007331 [Saccharopolyspora phatthalungensis]|uniref:Uncharacterized protein n=1 Tax=Saccharopolyspora phatthalungensis TaxID=664693 RepID=A0A840QB14_9PSEU|nr:hypothetical protein [Saccharopolyspora phatthalungensis]
MFCHDIVAGAPKGPPKRAHESSDVRCFRYKAGVVGESLRVLHYQLSADEHTITSLCQQTFRRSQMDECSEGTGAPCEACVLRAIRNVDQVADIGASKVDNQAELVPCHPSAAIRPTRLSHT